WSSDVCSSDLAVRAIGHRRAGAALSDLADPGRYAFAAALACDRGFERTRVARRRAARRLAGGLIGHRAAVGAQLRLVRSQSGGGADHLSAAGRSPGAPVCLLLR